MMNLTEAKDKILKEGVQVTRHGWGLCKIVRKATEGDVDYINFPPEGLIVEDCSGRICDCKIAIFQPTVGDEEAEDYVIAV